MDDVNTTEGVEMKNISDLRKIDNLIIHKEGENDKTPLYVLAALSVVLIIAHKP